MVSLECEELHFLFPALFVNLSALIDPALDRLDALLELEDLVLLTGALVFLLLDNCFKVSLAVLCLLLLAHSEGHSALVESLISFTSHLDVIANSQ